MPNFIALYWPQGWKKDTIKFGKPVCNSVFFKDSKKRHMYGGYSNLELVA
jgi:hypothetical protein